LFNIPDVSFNYTFENCVVRVDDLVDEMDTPDFFDNCDPCIPEAGTRDAILFVDPNEGDYHLDSLSIADGFGRFLANLQEDIEGTVRDRNMPDVGCFERVE